MKRTTILAPLLLTLALAACMPDPPAIALQVNNFPDSNGATVCSSIRATLTFAGGTLEIGPVELGESVEDFIDAPKHTFGKPITLEAWCDTEDTTGYAKLDGTLRELTGRLHLTRIAPPNSANLCREDLAESTDPAPCITSGDII